MQSERRGRLSSGLLFGGVVAAAAVVGGLATARGKDRGRWYRRLDKPGFTPPDWLFGPVWTALYGLMAVSGYRVFRSAPSPARSRALKLWGTQLALNAAWSPLFFGRHRPTWALVDLGGLLLALRSYVKAAKDVDPPAARLMAPYLAWTSYAGVLNAEIVRRN